MNQADARLSVSTIYSEIDDARLCRMNESLLSTYRTTAIASAIVLLDQRRLNALDRGLKSKVESLNVEMAKLNTLSPLAVLTRGYSITQMADGAVLRDSAAAKPGDKLNIRLEHGKLNAEVLSVEG